MKCGAMVAVIGCFASVPAWAQDQGALGERMNRLEADNAELRRRLDVVADELEKRELGPVVISQSDSTAGLGPAASKVYQSRQGVSIGGYGEALFKEEQGTRKDEADMLRAVMYLGYKFDDTWVYNSEIEFEHALAGEGKKGEVAVEFAYLDGQLWESTAVRAGVVLVPMGLVNERHEPTTFASTNRPFVERFILPTTWRELGVGAWGSVGPVEWRAYAMTGLDASKFSAGGIRDGRQSGSKAIAEDAAYVARADWRVCDLVSVGGSVYYGEAGQNLLSHDIGVTIFEAHGEFNWRALSVRALYAQSDLDGVAVLNADQGLTGAQSIGDSMRGGYLEAAYDVFAAIDAGSNSALEPFVRVETFDTQSSVPKGFASNPANDREVVTFGVAYRPNASIVFKVDYSDFDNQADNALDQFNVALGFTF